jgi:two-component system NtrC family sensor kinase
MILSSIKFKMTLAVFLLTFSLMLVTATTSLFFFEKSFKQNLRHQQFALLNAVATQIDERIFDALVALDTSADAITPAMLARPEKAQDFLDSRKDRLNFFDNGLLLFSKSGRLLAATPRELNLIGKDYSFRDYFKETVATGKICVSAPFASIQKTSHPIVMFTTPVYDAGNKMVAVLGGSVDLSKQHYLRSMAATKLGQKGYFSLYDATRTVLMHPDRSRLLMKDPAGANDLLAKALTGFEGTEETSARNHTPVLRSVKMLKSTGWVLAASYPLDDAYGPLRTFREDFLGGSLAAALFSLLVVWPFMKYLTKPLLSFTRHLEQFPATEEALQPVSIHSNDEIGILARTFNRLVLELGKRRLELVKQKEFAESLVLNSSLPTFVLDPQHNLMIWNKACEEFTGVKAAGIIGTNRHWSAFHNEERPSLADVIVDKNYDILPLQHMKCERSTLIPAGWHCEGWYENMVGMRRYILLDAAPIYDNRGELVAAIETVRDITELKNAEQALERSRDFYLTLLETFPTLIWRCGADAKYDYFNQTWLDFTGRTREQEHGDGWIAGVHPEDRDFCLTTHSDAFQVRKPFKIKYRLRRHDAQYRWVVDMGRPFNDQEGNFAGYLGTCYDVTEQHESSDKILKLSRVIEQNPNSIVIATLAGTVEYLNPKAVEATDYSLEELVGQHIRLLRPTEATGEIEQALHEVISLDKEWRGETSSREKGGEIFWEEISISPIKTPEGKVTHFVMIRENITQRKRFELSLRESEVRYRQLFENNPQPMWAYDRETLAFIAVNDAAVKHYGYSRQEFLAMTIKEIRHDEDVPALLACINQVRDTTLQAGIWRHVKKDGTVISVEITDHVTQLGGRISGIVLANDMTEKMRAETEKTALENQLRQSQKMEAIGTLAGGIAHDFNNILSAIIGYATLMRMKMEHDDPLQRKVGQILAASDRATKLTKGLLSYSRKQITETVPVGLNSVINNVQMLLRQVLTEDIGFDLLLTEDELTIMADISQVEQVLMNLVANARDAMCDGGKLSIATELATLDHDFVAAHGYGIPGSYAVLSITDSGTGMDHKTRERIFEPFFTTKEVGKGTGLGLAMVYGIVKQHAGYINCYSEPGHGTVFRIYLPLIHAQVKRVLEAVEPNVAGGHETILLVEDDAELREMVGELLEDCGYTVIKAVDGGDAVHKFKEFSHIVQMVILDVVMPKMNGVEAYEKISSLSTGVKALFMSGYTADFLTSKSVINESYNFMSKPLSTTAFLGKVREILDSD